MNVIAGYINSCNIGGYVAPNNAVSSESIRIRKLFYDFIFHRYFQNSVDNVYSLCLPQFQELLEEYSEANWDGFGSIAINIDSYKNAQTFLLSLPASTPLPEVVVEPDGEVAFEWYVNPSKVFSVSVGPKGELHYAGIFNQSQISGLEYFEDDIPGIIIDQINKLFD